MPLEKDPTPGRIILSLSTNSFDLLVTTYSAWYESNALITD
jgi:hypothetical protein